MWRIAGGSWKQWAKQLLAGSILLEFLTLVLSFVGIAAEMLDDFTLDNNFPGSAAMKNVLIMITAFRSATVITLFAVYLKDSLDVEVEEDKQEADAASAAAPATEMEEVNVI